MSNTKIKINNIISTIIEELYDTYGADPDEPVLSTQEVHGMLIDIEIALTALVSEES